MTDMDLYELNHQPASSKGHINWAMNKIKKHQADNNLHVDLKKDDPCVVAQYLRKFYYDLEKSSDGKLYPANSLRCMRAAISRYLRNPPHPRNDINILSDKEFISANQMLQTKSKNYARKDYAKRPEKKHAISETDIQKIGRFLKENAYENPHNLQLATWFLLCHFFAKRGRQNWIDYTLLDLQFGVDETGERYVTLDESRLRQSKTYQGSLRAGDIDLGNSVRLFDRPEKNLNPYRIIKTYAEKLSINATPDTRLFVYCNKNYEKGVNWYYPNKPIGKNAIANFMKKMNTQLKLEQDYTNHTVGRTTIVSILSDENYTPHQITNLTRHKNLQSLQSYRDDQLSETNIKNMHQTLTEKLYPSTSTTAEQQLNPTETLSKQSHSTPNLDPPTDNNQQQENHPPLETHVDYQPEEINRLIETNPTEKPSTHTEPVNHTADQSLSSNHLIHCANTPITTNHSEISSTNTTHSASTIGRNIPQFPVYNNSTGTINFYINYH